MIELASLRFENINLCTSRKVDLEDEPLMLKWIEEGVIGCNIGFISRVLTHLHLRLDPILNPNMRKFSRPSNMKNRINEERKSHPKNDIDGNSDGMTFQWRIVKG